MLAAASRRCSEGVEELPRAGAGVVPLEAGKFERGSISSFFSSFSIQYLVSHTKTHVLFESRESLSRGGGIGRHVRLKI